MEIGMDPFELEERQHLAEEVAGSVKRALPRIDVEPVSADGDSASAAESAGEDRESGMQPLRRPDV
jgi:hypothetical protein